MNALDARAEINNGDSTGIYIRQFGEYWNLKAISTQKTFTLSLRDKNLKDVTMYYAPNLGAYLGLGIYIFDIGIDVSFRVPPSDVENELYGNSSGTDLQLHMYTRRLGVDLGYQDYKGFYLENPEDFYTGWSQADSLPHKADMEAKSISLGSVYVFNTNRYSFPSIFTHTESQLRSAGSFILSGQFNHSNLSDPVSIVSEVPNNQIDLLDSLYKITSTSLNVLPGYTYNLVIKRTFYLSLSLSAGIGYESFAYTTQKKTVRDNSIDLAYVWRVGAGYNGNRLFFGLSGYTNSNETKIEGLTISTSSGFVKVFLGYRFMEKGFLKKSVFDILKRRNKNG
jgi:hypothetical protein